MNRTDPRPTNGALNNLLTHLGFEPGETTGKRKTRRVWEHPEAGTIILLPANRTHDPALLVDLVSLRAHLDDNGHLDGDAFDEFARTGRTPAGA
jgi:hypothetical protein